MAEERAVLRVGNCSGFYGDRLSAMRELLEGAKNDGQSLDVITGDYLAELTMLILGKDQLKDSVATAMPARSSSRLPTVSTSPWSRA